MKQLECIHMHGILIPCASVAPLVQCSAVGGVLTITCEFKRSADDRKYFKMMVKQLP